MGLHMFPSPATWALWIEPSELKVWTESYVPALLQTPHWLIPLYAHIRLFSMIGNPGKDNNIPWVHIVLQPYWRTKSGQGLDTGMNFMMEEKVGYIDNKLNVPTIESLKSAHLGKYEAVLYWVRLLGHLAQNCVHWWAAACQGFTLGSFPVLPGDWTQDLCMQSRCCTISSKWADIHSLKYFCKTVFPTPPRWSHFPKLSVRKHEQQLCIWMRKPWSLVLYSVLAKKLCLQVTDYLCVAEKETFPRYPKSANFCQTHLKWLVIGRRLLAPKHIPPGYPKPLKGDFIPLHSHNLQPIPEAASFSGDHREQVLQCQFGLL